MKEKFLGLLRGVTGRDALTDIGTRLQERLEKVYIETKVASALARAGVTAGLRKVDPRKPQTWEFSGFSQHGEDGILAYLRGMIPNPNRFFFEIGSAGGIENCTMWFAVAHGYGGIMVEGDPQLTAMCKRALGVRGIYNVHAVNRFVNRENIEGLVKMSPHRDPDIFVIDIDSTDYYIMSRALELGMKPKIVTVEYNSVFGPEKALTVTYKDTFSRDEEHPSRLYYGASVMAWRNLLGRHGYRFVTVDSSGVNAFFVDSNIFSEEFVSSLEGVDFVDNMDDLNGATEARAGADGVEYLPRRDWRAQFPLIEGMEFVNCADAKGAPPGKGA